VHHLSLFITVLVLATVALPVEAKRQVTVTPKNSKAFRCQVGPESIPMVIEDGMLRLRVGVVGAKGPYYWRVPFRQYSNGENAVSLAQAGEMAATKGEFTIAVDTTQLTSDNEARKIDLLLVAKNGEETKCTTQIALLETAVAENQAAASEKNTPPLALTGEAAVR
jgi:hypothetical protein